MKKKIMVFRKHNLEKNVSNNVPPGGKSAYFEVNYRHLYLLDIFTSDTDTEIMGFERSLV